MTQVCTASPRRHRRAVRQLLTAAALAALLAGCNQHQKAVQNVYPNDYRERHPITLKEGEHTVEVFLGRNRGGLSPVQRADVVAFAQTWRNEGTSGVIIDVPRGGPTDRAAADSLREINSILAAVGVPRRAIYLRQYHPSSNALASIKISYSKLTATAGPCGLWPHDLGPAADVAYNENQSFWNLGCASQRNLASMIDNPADLVQPRGETPAYAARRSVAIDKYRQGQDPSGTYNAYDKSKISDLGK